MPESAVVACGGIQLVDYLEFSLVHSVNDHLSDSGSSTDRIGLSTEIDQRNFDLTSVICIYGSR